MSLKIEGVVMSPLGEALQDGTQTLGGAPPLDTLPPLSLVSGAPRGDQGLTGVWGSWAACQ